jgi:hypothetical protein
MLDTPLSTTVCPVFCSAETYSDYQVTIVISKKQVQGLRKTSKCQTIVVFDRVVDYPSGPGMKGPKGEITVLYITRMGIVCALKVLGGFIHIGSKKSIARPRWSRVIHRFTSRKQIR